jgi:hypothetical protein
VTARVSEGAFWVFGVFGMLSTRQRTPAESEDWRIRWTDGAVAIVAIVAVRTMATGILLR